MDQKRNTLKKIAGFGAVATLMPTSWTKPIISSVILPAHAQTSACDISVTFTGGNDHTTISFNAEENEWLIFTDEFLFGPASPIITKYAVIAPFTLSIYSDTFSPLDAADGTYKTIDVLNGDDIVCSVSITVYWG